MILSGRIPGGQFLIPASMFLTGRGVERKVGEAIVGEDPDTKRKVPVL
jgi:hypothetical protein